MTPERIKQIYDEIGKHIIELDRDPSARGPKYLQDLIAQCRGSQNSVSRFLHEVHLEQHNLETTLRALRASFQVSADELLTSDKRVMHLPSIDDRNAMINTLLRKESAKVKELEQDLHELGFVEKAVKHRAKELSDTMSAIRLQRSLMRDEIDTGSMYGDETRETRDKAKKDGDLDDLNDDDYKDLLEGIESEDDAEPDEVEDDAQAEDDEEEVVEDDEDETPGSDVADNEDEASEDDEKIVLEDDDEAAKSGTPQDVGEAKSDDTDIKDFLEEDDYSDLFEGLEDDDEV